MSKRFAYTVLFLIALSILIAGVFFSIYGYISQATFKIMGNNVPGAIFGLVAVFLGVRYMISLKKLKKKIEESNSMFSWDNFKKSRSI